VEVENPLPVENQVKIAAALRAMGTTQTKSQSQNTARLKIENCR
jgi:hypothetical protein